MTSLLKKGFETHTRNRSLDALGALVVAVIGTLLSFGALGIAYILGWNTQIFWVIIPIQFVYKFVTVFFKNRKKTNSQKGK